MHTFLGNYSMHWRAGFVAYLFSISICTDLHSLSMCVVCSSDYCIVRLAQAPLRRVNGLGGLLLFLAQKSVTGVVPDVCWRKHVNAHSSVFFTVILVRVKKRCAMQRHSDCSAGRMPTQKSHQEKGCNMISLPLQ